MKKLIKKAFTLVELLVVIAILAVLSTVAVVGYNGFVEKAEISADQQAVVQMNLALQADSITEKLPQNTTEVASILYKNGYNGDFRNAHEEYEFVWLKDVNVVALMEDFVIVYPKAYEGRPFDNKTTFYFDEGIPRAFTDRFKEEQLHIAEISAYVDLLNNEIIFNDEDELKKYVPIDLDGGMLFAAIDDEETIKKCPYKDYYVDFVIKSNIDFNFKGYLWGQYDNFKEDGVAVFVDGLDIEAGVSYNVLSSVFPTGFTYQTVVESIKEFKCGIKVFDEVKEAYKDSENPLIITLELNMYEDIIDGVYQGEPIEIGEKFSFTII